MAQQASKKELRIVRASLSALLFSLAVDLLVVVSTKIGLRLARVRQDEMKDEFVYSWIPAASDSARLLLGVLSIGALAMMVARLEGATRRAMRLALVAATAAWIFRAFARSTLSGSFDWMADWRVVAALGDITRLAAALSLSFALSALSKSAPGMATPGRTVTLLAQAAMALAVAGPLVFWISVVLVSHASWLALVPESLSIATQALMLVLSWVARRAYSPP